MLQKDLENTEDIKNRPEESFRTVGFCLTSQIMQPL